MNEEISLFGTSEIAQLQYAKDLFIAYMSIKRRSAEFILGYFWNHPAYFRVWYNGSCLYMGYNIAHFHAIAKHEDKALERGLKHIGWKFVHSTLGEKIWVFQDV